MKVEVEGIVISLDQVCEGKTSAARAEHTAERIGMSSPLGLTGGSLRGWGEPFRFISKQNCDAD